MIKKYEKNKTYVNIVMCYYLCSCVLFLYIKHFYVEFSMTDLSLFIATTFVYKNEFPTIST